MKLPNEILDLIAFLDDKGFVLHHREGPDPKSFGNMFMEYSNGRVKVRIELDRSYWNIEMADAAQPDEWYDAEILGQFIFGRGPDGLSLAKQVCIVKTSWKHVMDEFSPLSREDTHARLKLLEHERGLRLFPPE